MTTMEFNPSDHQRPDSVTVVTARGDDSFTLTARTERIDHALIHDGPVFRALLRDLVVNGGQPLYVVLPDSIWTVSGRDVIDVQGEPLRP